jgi:hypothetical protein
MQIGNGIFQTQVHYQSHCHSSQCHHCCHSKPVPCPHVQQSGNTSEPEFMRLKIADIPKEFIKLYHLWQLATPDGYVYVRVQKGMYGLPQAGIIAQQLLEK